MTAAIFIYIAEVFNNIGVLLVIFGVIGILVYAAYTIGYATEYDKYHNKHWTLIAPITMIAVACFIPSSKTMYMMAGALLGEQALESKVGQQLKEMLELKLDQELAKMKKEASK